MLAKQSQTFKKNGIFFCYESLLKMLRENMNHLQRKSFLENFFSSHLAMVQEIILLLIPVNYLGIFIISYRQLPCHLQWSSLDMC